MSERGPFVQPDLLSRVEVAIPAVAPGFVLPGELLDAEMWLAARMREHGVDTIFEGVTDPEVRKARFRQHIVEGGLQMVMACHAEDGRTAETYAEAFERIYLEPLELEVTKRRRKNTPQRDGVMNPPESAAEDFEAGNPTMSPRKEGRVPLADEASAAQSASAAEGPSVKSAEVQATSSAVPQPDEDDSIAF